MAIGILPFQLYCLIIRLPLLLPKGYVLSDVQMTIWQATLWINLITWSKELTVPFIHLQCVLLVWILSSIIPKLLFNRNRTGSNCMFTVQPELELPSVLSLVCTLIGVSSARRERMWTAPMAHWNPCTVPAWCRMLIVWSYSWKKGLR